MVVRRAPARASSSARSSFSPRSSALESPGVWIPCMVRTDDAASVLMVAIGEPPKVGRAAAIVANNLRIDSATAEVLRAFEVARVQALLLKGPSVVRWLYDPQDARTYVDCDLLVRPTDIATAEHVLTNRGFVPNVYEREMPTWWREHAVGWLRPDDGTIVDLHQTLPGVGVDPQRVWLTLSAEVEGIQVAGFATTTLTIPGRALHLALHAAQHGVGWPTVTAELDRALARTDQAVWRAAVELAGALDAIPAFAAGLRTTAAGRGVAFALDLPTDRPVDVALRASTPPPVALGFDQLARAENWRARLTIMRHKVVPPATFVQAWSPLARHGRLGLALAYAWRPLWLLRHAPAGLRAWLAARWHRAR
jgi:hypothetical protein